MWNETVVTLVPSLEMAWGTKEYYASAVPREVWTETSGYKAGPLHTKPRRDVQLISIAWGLLSLWQKWAPEAEK
jgi:hypothetical protein